ncbi:flagellar assembly protein FliW [Oceanotoga sp. DSM 15011]|jgi:flagellar assembly factor FliW|uniref:Flagellar assembly factor FliW n=1 Tax=Oceanotoga teriensis TaxID=515440 RepID=A0AA45HHJ2_9BACT|nr:MULTISPECIES: flagellar assembly protein FliW [Oceanotoga]MDN5342342.1 flagellar assembly factor FliW [Oceanotoga sp.]MDO7976119.1 flagellar assembly protein FliW [Oceanotoga teriensis]PWJ87278.1 flagellar assembly factor FliW [Oceanotoga teriensis]UYP00955.1 flagellar assembly protein FliW [Oceanotoga sp. DSM 15011]
MEFNTKLGKISIDTNRIINFEYGLPGFENLNKFTLLNPEETKPIMWLASLEDENVALPVLPPNMVRIDYDIYIPEDIIEYLNIEDKEDLVLLSILTIPQNGDITINLAAPILISNKTKKGAQVLIEKSDYNIKHNLNTEIKRSKDLSNSNKDVK